MSNPFDPERMRRLVSTTRQPTAAARKALREGIHGQHLLLGIEDILARLMAGEEAAPSAPPGMQPEAIPLTTERIAALRAALDGHFKLLGKVLPDLKAVELTGSDGGPLQVEEQTKSSTELAARLVFMLRQQSGTTVDGEVETNGFDFLR